jgi:hypothetical protein
VRLGIAHHYGWAVAVTATDDHDVVDRRRIELIEPGLPPAPIHHEGGPHAMHRAGAPLSDDELAALVVDVRAAVVRATAASLDELPAGISSISVRSWPPDFPTAVEIARRPPHESRADSVMYCQVLAVVEGPPHRPRRHRHRGRVLTRARQPRARARAKPWYSAMTSSSERPISG